MISGDRPRSCVGAKPVAQLAILAALAFMSVMPPAAPEDLLPPAAEPIVPIPSMAAGNPAKVRLGERLFRDVRLSHDEGLACVSCHRLDRGGDDGQTRSIGGDGHPLDFNTPTVFNAALNFRLNWRGNFWTLEEQAEAVLLDPRLMRTSWPELIARLDGDQSYRDAFEAAYGQPPARPQILDALAAFERSLVTPQAPFDRYLAGKQDAIGPDAKRGYELFKSHGCVACHQGMNVGGNLFERFGVFEDPFAGGRLSQADLGRFALTGKAEDRSVFRVPSLRNVAKTAPYFHDGRAATLEQAVGVMARVQLGRELGVGDVGLIVRFLHTLTGEYQPAPSGQRTSVP
jgi:cytochrome c peroxidase